MLLAARAMPATLPSPSRRLNTFDGLAEDVVTYCLQHAALATARRGELLIRQGEPARLVYVIKSGYAKFVSTSPDGHEVLVAIAGPFDVFGQAAATEHLRTYLVTATALTPMELVIWSRTKALELADMFPEIHARLDAQMIANLDLLLGRLHTVSEGHVPQRLTRALLELAERHGEKQPRGVAINPPLTRQDLAALTGTTLYTVSRLLADWEHRGLVATSRGHVQLLDLQALQKIADSASVD
jgi:CRP/FNR family transcriptional regulator, nitrogen oxide reductase regulator